MRQAEDYETAKFTGPTLESVQAIANEYHATSTIVKTVVVVLNHVKTTTIYRLNEEPEVIVEQTDEDNGKTETREGKMVQSTITSLNGGVWELTLRVSDCYWERDKEDEDKEDEDEEDDETYDEDGDDIPGNSREYPTVSVQCSMQEQSILNHERLRGLGSTEKSAISALLNGASEHDQIKVRSNKYRAINKILDFSLGDGFGNCLNFVQYNPTYSAPVTHITYRYKSSNKPEMPAAGKAVQGNMMPGTFKKVEGYVCVFVGAGYEYRKGAPVFVEMGEEV